LKFIKSFFTKQKIPITTQNTSNASNSSGEISQSAINVHILDSADKITEYSREYCLEGQSINYMRTNIPIISVSNVTGFNIPETRNFLTSLQQYHNYNNNIIENIKNGVDVNKTVNYMISTAYNVKGVGLVVTGVLKSGIIRTGDVLYIGPFHNYYYRVTIRGIHNNFRESVDFLSAGYSGCLAIKPVNSKVTIKKNAIRSGTRILSVPQSIMEFQATVRILQNPSTISKRYTPIIQCVGITQPANILRMDKEYLRSYDESTIHFKFIYRPEYIEDGALFVFREGLTKGVGKIKSITINPNLIIE
jgi:elongation factor 1-alpha